MTTRKKKESFAENAERENALRKLGREAVEVDASVFETGGKGYCTDEPENGIGQRIEYQRRAQTLTQGQLADLTKQADTTGKGLSRGVISLYELGINRPGIKEVRLLCEVLRVSPSYLIYGDDDPFGTKASSLHFGGIAKTEPEFLSRAVYCLYRLDSEHSIALVQMMIGMLRGELKGFDSLMEAHADKVLLDMADNLRATLEDKGSKLNKNPK